MRICKNSLHGQCELGGDAVGQIERGIMFSAFQRNDGLAGNTHAVSEFFLCPIL